jgi:capsid protein
MLTLLDVHALAAVALAPPRPSIRKENPVTPRVTPSPLAPVTDPEPLPDVTAESRRAVRARQIDEDIGDPYRAQHAPERTVTAPNVAVHSYFRDLLLVAESEARASRSLARAVEHGGRGGRDEGPAVPPADGWGDDTLEAARRRLVAGHKRDLSASGNADMFRPSVPGWIADVFGRAARQTGMLATVFERRPLEPGMVDVSGGQAVLKAIPRFASGAAVAVQSTENAAVEETDPTTASTAPPVGTIAGNVDLSRQLFEFSQPGMDGAISDDLGRAHGTVLDAQIVNGSGAGHNLRGLLNVAGILSVAGTVTSAATFIESVWKAYSALAGGSGYGTASAHEYVVIVHPRRFAWARGNTTGIQAQALLPGTVVASAGVPTNLGAGTNEDVALVVERSAVILVGDSPTFHVFEQVGSGTLTVRISSWNQAALVVKHPAAVARVTGLTPPSGF